MLASCELLIMLSIDVMLILPVFGLPYIFTHSNVVIHNYNVVIRIIIIIKLNNNYNNTDVFTILKTYNIM